MRRKSIVVPRVAIRSGKLKAAKDTSVLVAYEKGNRTYRVFNGGEGILNLYDIASEPDASTATVATCSMGCSVDLEVKRKLWARSDAEIRGIYDLVNRESTVRSGRVRSPKSGSATQAAMILDGGHNFDACLRIMNSGSSSIRVLRQTTEIVTLSSKQSVDVGYRNDAVSVEPDDPEKFEAIYDRIDLLQPTRSGRVSLDAPADTQPVPRTVVVDVTSADSLTYRIFNSGDFSLKVVLDENNSSTSFTLAAEQSIDLTLSGRSKLSLEGITNGKAMVGIYEYVG